VTYLENSKTFDPLRPGEQWFYYWKTSAVLWESQILQFPKDEIVFLPLYWGLHAESVTSWDFGQTLPERDLLRLHEILTHHDRKYCWIIPLSPAPFFPNGGISASAARSLSLDKNGVQLAVLDHEMNLNKIFSFFEPKVFGAYAGFLKEFGHFLRKNKIKSPVWGAELFYYQDGKNHSFFDDQSLAFEQGFSRFLKALHSENLEISDAKSEKHLKQKYTDEVKKLFTTTAEEALGSTWMGVQKIVILGASPKDTILRSIPSGKSQLEYAKDLFYQLTNSFFISSALLTAEEKKDLLNSMIVENFGHKEIQQKYNLEPPQSYNQGLSQEFVPYSVIDLFGSTSRGSFTSTKLLSYLHSNFKSLYTLQADFPFHQEWIDANQARIKLFNGAELHRGTFSQLLKLFMMGQRILLDRTGLAEDLEKKLQIFLVENNIKMQSVNFITSIEICELGEGVLIIFQGDRLNENPQAELFWPQIFKFFDLSQPEVTMDPDVFSVWKIRATSPHELSYLNVRRLNLYNPTSYKKIVTIRTHKHFAFMKMIDPSRAKAKSTPSGVDVEILPQGKIALDFGHYEDT
jgi:hypothetical protein